MIGYVKKIYIEMGNRVCQRERWFENVTKSDTSDCFVERFKNEENKINHMDMLCVFGNGACLYTKILRTDLFYRLR